MSRPLRAGLQFGIGRLSRKLREGGYASCVCGAAPVLMAAVLECVVAEVFELASSAAEDSTKTRLILHRILMAVRDDDELNNFFDDAFNITFASHSATLPMAPFPSKRIERIDDDDALCADRERVHAGSQETENLSGDFVCDFGDFRVSFE